MFELSDVILNGALLAYQSVACHAMKVGIFQPVSLVS